MSILKRGGREKGRQNGKARAALTLKRKKGGTWGK